jgi:hypothetical protein
LTCTNCGNVQDDGKFCGKCGTPLNTRVEEVSTKEEAATVVSQLQFDSNANVGTSGSSSQYFTYFTTHLKNPTQIFANKSKQTVNGIITWLLFVALIGLVVYSALDAFIQFSLLEDWFYREAFPTNYFMKFFTKAALFAAIYTGTIIFILFGLINLFIGPKTIKWVAQMYGTLLIPAIVMAAVTWLLIILDSYTVALVACSLTFTMATLILPFVMLYQTARETEPKIDRAHLGLIYLGSYTLASYILYFIILESTFISFTKYVQELVYYFG